MSEKKIVLDVLQVDDKLIATLPEARITISDGPKKAATEIPYLNQAANGGSKWAWWGYNDALPNEIREKLEKVPIATATISKLTAMMYGNGIAYYKTSDLARGPKVDRAYIPEVQSFLSDNDITLYLLAQIVNYRYYMNTFCEMVMSRDKRRVMELHHQEAEFCRLSVRDMYAPKKRSVFFSPDFALKISPGESRYAEVPLYVRNPKFVDQLSGHKFFVHSYFPTPASLYYARPFWLGLCQKDGWLDISANITKIISAMQNNQIVLKYQINIPESYFAVRHAEWDTYTAEQRTRHIAAKITEINNALTGTENAFRSISSVFKEDPNTHQAFGKIEIIAIDDKTKKDAWVPDANASDAQIVQGLTLHPSQVGLAPAGGKMGAGSGSDQRESFNTQISLNTMDQEIILRPLQLISKLNGWDVTFFIDHTHHTTTNKEETGLVPSPNTIIPQ
jgi:hypothetical protein